MTTDDQPAATRPHPGERVQILARGASAEERFTAFAEASIAGLTRIAVMLCGDEHRAHDLVQVALERTYRAWHRVGDGEPFAYARKVIATARIDTWRSTRRDLLVDPHQLRGAVTRDPAEAVLHRDEVVRALRMLPPAQRRVIVLRYLLDQTEAQTAAELGISVGAVKSATSRGLARLRVLLDGALVAPGPVPVNLDGRTMAERAVRREKRRRAVLAVGAAALAALLVVVGMWAVPGLWTAAPVLPGQRTSVLGPAPSSDPAWSDPPRYEPLARPAGSWTEESVGSLRLSVPSGWTRGGSPADTRRGSWYDGPAEVSNDRAELYVHRQAERYPWDKTVAADVTHVEVDGAASVLVVRDDDVGDFDRPVFSAVAEIVLEEGGVYVVEYTAPDGAQQEQLLGTILGSLAVDP
ncbi:SigE family RNA polymerase sigma factor [Myceligenerans crystallogenes]|uniref:RNA polymerase sigma-70 factor, sigma-E family n=1 Tax=Myceligenerans crystallogenes TaxID=316335 RepID=A0ABN2N4S7_9MICO